jgi:hypothetical protein
LDVHDVGSYKASIVPSLDEFDRLDTNTFQIDHSLLGFLRAHYAAGFGFIVCKLKPGNNSYHPFAYTHALDFSGKLFVPTRHYHPNHRGEIEADWDHIIYSPLTDLDNTREKEMEFVNSKSIQWTRLPVAYRWGSVVRLSRLEIRGDFPNKDFWATSYHREAEAEVQKHLHKSLVDLIGGELVVQGDFKR